MIDAFFDADISAIPLTLLDTAGLADARDSLSPREVAWIGVNGFTAKDGQVLCVPDDHGGLARVLVGVARPDDIFALAGARAALPVGDYRIASPLTAESANRLALGWGLAGYCFSRYKRETANVTRLAWPAEADRDRVTRELTAIGLVRDLVNTPPNDLGPAALADAAQKVAEANRAECRIIVGDALDAAGYPAVLTVGRAAAEAPRVIDISWGDEGRPLVALVGKGVTFDSGGLDIKGAANMALMKKDMGGGAHALALGQMIMQAKLPVRLRILISAAENAVGSRSYRPSDVIKTRAGLTVEVGDTDAEGRLVLADALTAACESDPALVLDFATLTGAARVALGPDLPALFATDKLADDILAASAAADDPVWRLPLWQPYRKNLDSKIADINNIAPGGFAGAIYGGLFLQAFVKPTIEWAHFDLYAWNAAARPGRPVGGEAFAIRGLFHMLTQRYGR